MWPVGAAGSFWYPYIFLSRAVCPSETAIINEKAFDEVKHGVRKHGLSSVKDIIAAKEKERGFVSLGDIILDKYKCRLDQGRHMVGKKITEGNRVLAGVLLCGGIIALTGCGGKEAPGEQFNETL